MYVVIFLSYIKSTSLILTKCIEKYINIFNAKNYQDIFHCVFNETNLMFYMSVHFSRTWSKLKTFGMEGVDLTTLVFT